MSTRNDFNMGHGITPRTRQAEETEDYGLPTGGGGGDSDYTPPPNPHNLPTYGDITEPTARSKEKLDTPVAWQDYVIHYVEKQADEWILRKGLDPKSWYQFLEDVRPHMLSYVYNEWVAPGMQGGSRGAIPGGEYGDSPMAGQHGQVEETRSQDFRTWEMGMDALGKAAWSWVQSVDPSKSLSPTAGGSTYAPSISGGPPGPGRGSGATGPTLKDFDLDALTEAVQNMWRAYLLDDNPNARAIATEYANSIIKNPKQELDFDMFVLNKIRNTSRHKAIYRSKPDHVDERQYMTQYQQMASQVLRPDNVDDVAIMGAQMGADPNAYRGLLKNQRETQNTSNFINSFEDRLQDLRKVFRG